MNKQTHTFSDKGLWIVKHSILLVFCVVLGIAVNSCASGNTQADIRDAESAYKAGLVAFEKEDYFEAQRLFDLIRLQFPTTQFADDAQYYLAEINFARKEFVMAAFNYSMIRRSYPTSDLNKQALYKTALCYYELSPPADRDQDYTKKAIVSFSEFQAIYSTDSLSGIAGKFIVELRNRLAEREMITAELYRNLYSNRSALIYFETVLEDYPDTEFYEQAFVGKIESLIALRRYDEAKSVIELYRKRFSAGKLAASVTNAESLLPKD